MNYEQRVRELLLAASMTITSQQLEHPDIPIGFDFLADDLTALIAEAQREARIDEVGHLMETIDDSRPTYYCLRDRVAELKKEAA